MAARAIWKAEICFDAHCLPVKLYSAVQDRNLHFRLLHDRDLTPIKQRLVNSMTGKEVERAKVQKGFAIDRQKFVILDDADLAALEPEASREISVITFVDPELINHQWYDRPYWLGPDGDQGAYFALTESLMQSGLEGICRWTMRSSRYLGALRCHDGYLLLETLRYVDEVIDGSQLPSPAGRDLSSQEQKMAAQLIDALADQFRPGDYLDEYRSRVLEMIAAKRRGEKLVWEEYKPEEESDSLSESLAASLRTMKRR